MDVFWSNLGNVLSNAERNGVVPPSIIVGVIIGAVYLWIFYPRFDEDEE